MRVIVTGSRHFTDSFMVWEALDDVMNECDRKPEPLRVVHGEARGADRFAAEWVRAARGLGFGYVVQESELHRALWQAYGKRAGFLRNREMVEAGADRCLAFLKEGAENKGTLMTIALAERRGIEVVRYWGD